MIRPIYTYGDDILRIPAEDIDINDPQLPQLISDMFETMHNANGAGLAAPQIGISKKIIVVEEKMYIGSEEQIFKRVFINPKLITMGGDMISLEEACLSIPGISAKVHRPFMIALSWYDEDKEFNKQLFIDIPSRIIQHELDHLEGKLYIDRLNPDDHMKLFSQLEDIKNKRIKIDYPINDT